MIKICNEVLISLKCLFKSFYKDCSYVAQALQSVVILVQDPLEMHYLWKIRHAPIDIFKESKKQMMAVHQFMLQPSPTINNYCRHRPSLSTTITVPPTPSIVTPSLAIIYHHYYWPSSSFITTINYHFHPPYYQPPPVRH